MSKPSRGSGGLRRQRVRTCCWPSSPCSSSAGRALHPGEVLYADRSDLLEETLPAKRFLVRSLARDGRAAAVVPVQLRRHAVRARRQGRACSTRRTGRCCCCPKSARRRPHLAGRPARRHRRLGHVRLRALPGLGVVGSLVAAAGYMFAGKWLLHLLAGGHYFMAPVAWLPLIVLGLEAAITRRSLAWATFAGAAFAYCLLGGHPQITFYSGVFAGLWTLGAALESAGLSWRCGAAVAPAHADGPGAVAGLWRLVRGGGGGPECRAAAAGAGGDRRGDPRRRRRSGGDAGEYAWQLFLGLVGPSLVGRAWEGRGALAALWLATAALAPVLRGGRTRFEAAVLVTAHPLRRRRRGPAAAAAGVRPVPAPLAHPAARRPGPRRAGRHRRRCAGDPVPTAARRARRVFLAVAVGAVLPAVGFAAPREVPPASSPAAVAWWGVVLVGVPLLGALAGDGLDAGAGCRLGRRPARRVVGVVVAAAWRCVPPRKSTGRRQSVRYLERPPLVHGGRPRLAGTGARPRARRAAEGRDGAGLPQRAERHAAHPRPGDGRADRAGSRLQQPRRAALQGVPATDGRPGRPGAAAHRAARVPRARLLPGQEQATARPARRALPAAARRGRRSTRLAGSRC